MSDGSPMDVDTYIAYDDRSIITVVLRSTDEIEVIDRKEDGTVTIKENLSL